MKKRILSLMLAAVMVLTSVDLTAFAQETENEAKMSTVEEADLQEEMHSSEISIVGLREEETQTESSEEAEEENSQSEPSGEEAEEDSQEEGSVEETEDISQPESGEEATQTESSEEEEFTEDTALIPENSEEASDSLTMEPIEESSSDDKEESIETEESSSEVSTDLGDEETVSDNDLNEGLPEDKNKESSQYENDGSHDFTLLKELNQEERILAEQLLSYYMGIYNRAEGNADYTKNSHFLSEIVISSMNRQFAEYKEALLKEGIELTSYKAYLTIIDVVKDNHILVISADEKVEANENPSDVKVYRLIFYLDTETGKIDEVDYEIISTEGVQSINTGVSLLSVPSIKSYTSIRPLPSLSGNRRQDAARIARSQIGYVEGPNNYNAYSAALGIGNNVEWCAIFATWCAYTAGINRSNWPSAAYYPFTTKSTKWFQDRGRWHNKVSYKWSYNGAESTCTIDGYPAQPGDFAAIENNGIDSDGPDHTALVVGNDGTYIYTVEGNMDNRVQEFRYYASTLKRTDDSSSWIVGFGEPDYGTGSTPTNTSPYGALDGVFGREGSIGLFGWAFDADDYSKKINLHVYVGGPAGSGASGYVITANQSRPDVVKVYPSAQEYCGFDTGIKVKERGTQPVYVYAIDAQDPSKNTLLGKKTVTIKNIPYSMEFGKDALYMDVNQEASFSCNFTGDGIYCLSYTLSDSTVASMTGVPDLNWTTGTGTIHVKGLKGGKSTLTIYLMDSQNKQLYSKSIPITVTQLVTSVTLNKTSTTLEVGSTEKLIASTLPSTATFKTLVWNSSNTEVVSVSGGTITAKSAGTATIRVREVGSGLKATCTVTVTAPLQSISLNKVISRLTVEQTDNLTVSYYPADTTTSKTVVWSSSNPSVATVSNGRITAKAAGRATITATVSGKTASCTVIVSPKKIQVTDISLNRSYALLYLDSDTLDKSCKLTATVTPTNATNRELLWTSSNKAVATVSSAGVVSAVAAGSTVITAAARDGSGVSASCTVTVNSAEYGVTSFECTEITVREGVKSTSKIRVRCPLPTGSVRFTIEDSAIASYRLAGNPFVGEDRMVYQDIYVDGLKIGKTSITALPMDDSGSILGSATIPITVGASVTGVKFSQNHMMIKKGEAKQLSYTVLPANAVNKTVTWETFEDSITCVDGVVTGNRMDVAMVRVRTEEGRFMDEINVVVVDEEELTAMMSVIPDSIVVEEGEEVILDNLPYEQHKANFDWDTAIAKDAAIVASRIGHHTSGNGNSCYLELTGKKTGTTKVTINYVWAGTTIYSKEIIVEVIPKFIPMESISLDKSALTLNVGDTETVEAKILPEDTTNKVIVWSSTKEEVAAVTDGKVYGISPGTAWIRAASEDGRILSEEILVSVTEPAADMEPEDKVDEDTLENETIPDGIWISGITDTVYTGSRIKQSFSVYDGETLLREKVDYTITYKNNKNACTYTDSDYQAFEKRLEETGKKTKVGTFNPAKAPQIIVKMKGNYTGSQTVYYRIEPVSITSSEFGTDDLAASWSGKKQTPAPVLTWNGKKLKYGKDFYVPEYEEAKKDKTAFRGAGTYELTVTGKNNFTGKIPITLTISESSRQIAMDKVSVKGIKDLPWTGQTLVQTDLTVSYKKDVLSLENGDYRVGWGTNQDVGTGTMTLTGTGIDTDGDGYSYIGTKTIAFKITGTPMSKVRIEGIEKAYTYTGAAIEPTKEKNQTGISKVKVLLQTNKKEDGLLLVENTHYTVSYQRNVDKGRATIIFTGLKSGGYTGSKKVSFNILADSVAGGQSEGSSQEFQIRFKDSARVINGIYTALYMKGGVTPEIIVTDGNKTLQVGKDYTVSYSNNKQVALFTDENAPRITIKGKGNYTGTKSIPFTITAKPLSNANGITVVAQDKAENGKKNGYRQSFKVYDADGRTLSASDYDAKRITYTLIQTEGRRVNETLHKNSVVPADSVIRITVQGKGNYAGGTATGTYRILEKACDIRQATIQLRPQEYTGEPVWITSQNQFMAGKVFIKAGKAKKMLVLGEDIEVVPGSYVKNVQKGTARVTFRGINEYGGTKTVSYRIGTRSIADFWEGVYESFSRMEELFGYQAP